METRAVTQMPMIACDSNGLPRGHKLAEMEAAQELVDCVNELPDSCYHMGPTDGSLFASRVIARYLASVRKAQW
jgi:hypothetical protein